MRLKLFANLRFTVDDIDVVTVGVVGLSSVLPICAELPLCGCGLVIWLFPLFTELLLLLLFVSVLLLLSPFKLVSDALLQGNDGVADFCLCYVMCACAIKENRKKEKNDNTQLDSKRCILCRILFVISCVVMKIFKRKKIT